MESKLDITKGNIHLIVEAIQSSIKICIFDSEKKRKLFRNLQISKDARELIQFQSASEIVELMRTCQNYQIDLQKQIIALKWTVTAHHYENPVICKISLFQEPNWIKDKKKYKKQLKQKVPSETKNEVDKRRGRKRKQQNQQVSQAPTEVSRKTIKDKFLIYYSNGDTYDGQIENSEFHGFGQYKSKKRGSYEGQWFKGKAHGQGRTIDSEGNIHEGLYCHDLKEGWGTDLYANGQKYEGQFKEDHRQGKGTYYYLNGDSYEGEWRKDICEGRGIERYADNSYFEGFWTDDEKNGQGVYTDCWKRKYLQVWKMGKILKSQPFDFEVDFGLI